MKYRLLLTLVFVSVLANVSGAQSDSKTFSISVSLAQPLGEMKLGHNGSLGGFLTYASPLDDLIRLSLRGGVYKWSRETTYPTERYSSYDVSIPVLAGVDFLLSNNYFVPFLGVHAGVQLYSGYTIRLEEHEFLNEYVVAHDKINNQAGFLFHPEIGWRLPFSSSQFLDIRGGYTYGTGEDTPFSYATFSLGLVFAIPSSR